MKTWELRLENRVETERSRLKGDVSFFGSHAGFLQASVTSTKAVVATKQMLFQWNQKVDIY